MGWKHYTSQKERTALRHFPFIAPGSELAIIIPLRNRFLNLPIFTWRWVWLFLPRVVVCSDASRKATFAAAVVARGLRALDIQF